MPGKIVWVENSRELTDLLAPAAKDAGFELECHHDYDPSLIDVVASSLTDADALILDLELVPGLQGQVGKTVLGALLDDETVGPMFGRDSLRLGVLSAHLIDHDFVSGVEQVAERRKVRPIYMAKSADMTRQQWRGAPAVDDSGISDDFVSFLDRLTDRDLGDETRREAIEPHIDDPWQLSLTDYEALNEVAQFACFDLVAEKVRRSNADLRNKGVAWVLYAGSSAPVLTGTEPAEMPGTEARREIGREYQAPCFGFSLTEMERVDSIDTAAPPQGACSESVVVDYPYLRLNLGGNQDFRECHYDTGSPSNYISNQWLRESGLVLAADEFIGQDVSHFALNHEDGVVNRVRAAMQARRTTLRIADWNHDAAYLGCPVQDETSRVIISARVIQNWSDWTHAVTCAEVGCSYVQNDGVCVRRHALLGRSLLRDNTNKINNVQVSVGDGGELVAKVNWQGNQE